MNEELQKIVTYMKELYSQAEQKESHYVAKKEEIMLPVSDGSRLKTTIWYPNDIACAPAVLVRSCYPDSRVIQETDAEEFCKRGFIFILQWCRGIGGSEGVWEPNVNDRKDGLDTLEWLNSQEFIESIGYWGNSYLAYTGWCMADAVPDKVKCMYLGVYGTNRYISAYKDGMFRQDILTSWAQGNAGIPIEADLLESYSFRPQIKVDRELWKADLEWYRTWISNTDGDSDYWNSGLWGRLKETPSKMKIPVCMWEGWYDHHLGSAVATYMNLSEEAKAHSVFRIGPWNHSHQPAITHQSVKNLADDSVQAPLSWFTQILKDKELPGGRVETYVIGADRWETWKTLPVPAEDSKVFYLSSKAAAGKEYGMSGKTGGKEGRATYVYDPLNPVMSRGCESAFSTQTAVGSMEQPPCGFREDVISFVSETVEEAFEINGEIQVKLFVSTDAEDTAFTAKVMEIFEDGTAVNIRGSITTLAYRNGAAARGTYKPDSVVEITVSMWDIAWLVQKGSRLRVDISSSDFPQYSVHSNYPGVWALQEKTKKANQTIYFGGAYPSRIELPCVRL